LFGADFHEGAVARAGELESANLYSAVLFSPASPSVSPGRLLTVIVKHLCERFDSSFYYEMIQVAGTLEDPRGARLHSLLQRGLRKFMVLKRRRCSAVSEWDATTWLTENDVGTTLSHC
jgi:hypothetical protein